MWLDRVKRVYGERLDVTWKHFSLEQINSKEGKGWKVWEQPDEYKGRSILAQRASEAARRQGDEAFRRFHMALLTARHGPGERIPLNETGPLAKVAREAGLDLGRFLEDLKDRGLLTNVARDHSEAVEKYGVFGTPTFVFENSTSAYLKSFIPPEDDSVAFFEHFVALFGHRSYVGEIKRPQPPWPKGAVGGT